MALAVAMCAIFSAAWSEAKSAAEHSAAPDRGGVKARSTPHRLHIAAFSHLCTWKGLKPGHIERLNRTEVQAAQPDPVAMQAKGCLSHVWGLLIAAVLFEWT